MKNGKTELVNKIVELSEVHAEETGEKRLTKKATNTFVDLFAEAVRQLVADEGDSLTIQNLLKVDKYESKPTTKRNPQTGEIIEVPAKIRTRAKANF